MKFNETLFDDVSRVVSGAANALSSVREQVHTRRPFGGPFTMNAAPGAVTREEFEAVSAMAAKARASNEALLARIEALEAKLGKQSDIVTPGGDDI